MELITVISLLGLVLAGLGLYLSFSSKHYKPEQVLVDEHEQVFVAHLPKARLSKRFGKTIAKDAIVTVQLAGGTVSLFTKSGNAIDIWTPRDALAKPIFTRAKQLFQHAETRVIDC